MSNEQLRLILVAIFVISFFCFCKYGPDELPPWIHNIVVLICASFAAWIGHLFFGNLDLVTTFNLSENWAFAIEASGGPAFFLIVIFWWNSRFSPVGKVTNEQLRERINTSENEVVEKFHPVQTKEEADTPLSKNQKDDYERLIAELKKNEELAKKHFDEEIERRLDTQLSLAGVFQRDGKYQEAEAAYRVILSADPDNTTILNGLGITLLALARFKEAETLIRRALEIDEAS